MTSNIRAALEQLVELNKRRAIASEWADAIAAARAALADPEPPKDGEVGETVTWLREEADIAWADSCPVAAGRLNRAADLLSRLAPQPVPEGPTLPTDEQLLSCRPFSSDAHVFESDLVDFARAVLARWGAPHV